MPLPAFEVDEWGVRQIASSFHFFPPSGWMRDITQSYPVSFSVLAVILYVTAVLWLPMSAARKYDLTHNDRMGKYEQFQEIEIKKEGAKKNNNEDTLLLNRGVQKTYLDSAT